MITVSPEQRQALRDLITDLRGLSGKWTSVKEVSLTQLRTRNKVHEKLFPLALAWLDDNGLREVEGLRAGLRYKFIESINLDTDKLVQSMVEDIERMQKVAITSKPVVKKVKPKVMAGSKAVPVEPFRILDKVFFLWGDKIQEGLVIGCMVKKGVDIKLYTQSKSGIPPINYTVMFNGGEYTIDGKVWKSPELLLEYLKVTCDKK